MVEKNTEDGTVQVVVVVDGPMDLVGENGLYLYVS